MNARTSIRLWTAAAACAVLFAAAPAANAAFLISYYNFNVTTANQVAFTANSVSGTLNVSPSGFTPTTFFTGSTINALGGDPAGSALSLVGNANNGGTVTIQFSTLGLTDIVLSFATQRTSTGFNSNQLAYSLDGVSYTNFGSAFNPATSFALATFDLSSISALNNQANVYLRYTLNGATSSSGNNRIDNLQVTGVVAVPAPTTLALAGIAGVCFGFRRLRRRK